jgi:hypothetical protein
VDTVAETEKIKKSKVVGTEFTSENAAENGRKGGIASGQARREKKAMRERIQELLEMSVSAGDIDDFTNIKDTKGKNLTVQDAIIVAQVQRALKGDIRAVEFLRDTAGMKPADKQEITATVGTSTLQSILNQLDDEPNTNNNTKEE